MLQEFSFIVKHRTGTENRVADALSRQSHVLSILSSSIIGLDEIKKMYAKDPFFGPIISNLYQNKLDTHTGYSLKEGFLFKGCILCIPDSSLREHFVRELYGGGLAGHFGRDKTTALVEDQFFWPSLKRDVVEVVKMCRTCQLEKGSRTNARLYTLLPIPSCSLGRCYYGFHTWITQDCSWSRFNVCYC